MQTIKLQQTELSKIWLSSDLHMYHKNICRGTTEWGDKENARNFDTLEEMTDAIINNINKYVRYGDKLFLLGDILFGNKVYLPTLMSRLVCSDITLILGNHDGYIQKNGEYIKLFSGGVYDMLHLEVDKKINVILSHYSQRVWMGSHKGYIHLYGHSHGSIPDFGKSMDVGIDNIFKRFGEYRPISLDEIKYIMVFKPIAFVDHHNLLTNVK